MTQKEMEKLVNEITARSLKEIEKTIKLAVLDGFKEGLYSCI